MRRAHGWMIVVVLSLLAAPGRSPAQDAGVSGIPPGLANARGPNGSVDDPSGIGNAASDNGEAVSDNGEVVTQEMRSGDIFTTFFAADDDWGLLSLTERLRADNLPERL